MRVESRTVNMYIADDGKEFTSEKDCDDYEKKIKDMRYFLITCEPDLTEGRGYYKQFIVKCNFGNDSMLIVQEYCRATFGRCYDFIMGCISQGGIMKKYIVKQISLEEVNGIVERQKMNGQYDNVFCKLDKAVSLTVDKNGNPKVELLDTFI